MRRFVVWAVLIAGGLLVVFPAGAKVSGENGWIAFSRFSKSVGDTVTYIVGPNGHGLRAFLKGHQTGLPRWSPEGTRLVMQAGLNNPCPPCAASTIILNPATWHYRILPPPKPHELSTQCSIWSPDGKQFACEVDSKDGRRNGISTIRTSDGRGFTRVLADPGNDDVPIDYSPNGRFILFGRNPHFARCHKNSALFVVGVNGRGLRRITPPGICDDDGSWSPNGKTIVFGDNGSLYAVHANGTGLRKITLQKRSGLTPLNAFDVGWSPSGTKIVFSLIWRVRPGVSRAGIATANPNGTDIRPLTNTRTIDSKADWGTFHP